MISQITDAVFTLIKAINPNIEMRFRLAHPKSLHYSKCEGLRWSSRVVVSKGYLSIPWYKKLTLHKSNVVKFVLAIALIARVLSDVSVKPNDCCSWYLVTANHLWKYPRDLNISFTISLQSSVRFYSVLFQLYPQHFIQRVNKN